MGCLGHAASIGCRRQGISNLYAILLPAHPAPAPAGLELASPSSRQRGGRATHATLSGLGPPDTATDSAVGPCSVLTCHADFFLNDTLAKGMSGASCPATSSCCTDEESFEALRACWSSVDVDEVLVRSSTLLACRLSIAR